ncbi:alpha/beta fold hydrolase [Paraglaciecola sp.]|uniref:alpha/beta fold hydrolase n=1 Tax=Paraglaciecola sp. TaxID=1920173 RepID=UPI00273FF43E|nr:alpha/beta hydrolase [Paraglaciecola sp.]MDP5030595.1 alpha/beta hydrolase [Paraglaciecola sp.]
MMKKILRLIGVMLLVVLLAAFGYRVVHNQPDRSVDELSARWAPSPSQFIDINGLQVHLRDEGPRDDPAPIILLHGTSASLHTWDGWTQALVEQQHRVIRFDLPGFGLTGPAVDNDYRIESYAQTVMNVLDSLNIEQATLAGNSLGGYIAWATAVLYPNRIKNLVLVDPSGYPYESESLPLAFKIAKTPILNQIMHGFLPRSLVASSVRNVYGDPSLVSEELIDRYFELTTRAGNRDALAERFKQTRPGAMVKRMAEIKVPTLILWGQKDRLIPAHLAEHFHQAIDNSQVHIFPLLGHVPQEEDPQQSVGVLSKFLEEHRTSQ